ncbi:MAG: hypothetical protein PHT03_04530 [Bacilli bacterium]|nr:hypothetical protein [Bacilli bacterium]
MVKLQNIYQDTDGDSKINIVDDFIFYNDESEAYLLNYIGSD